MHCTGDLNLYDIMANLQDFVCRPFRTGAALEPIGQFSRLFCISAIGKYPFYRIQNGGGIRLIKLNACTQLAYTFSHSALFRCLRQHDKGNLEIQALADAVHTAMGYECICLLKDGDFIRIAKDGSITLTRAGIAVAEKIYERHTFLSNLLIRLGVSEETAGEDACKLEHAISDTSFEAIKNHMTQYGNDKKTHFEEAKE